MREQGVFLYVWPRKPGRFWGSISYRVACGFSCREAKGALVFHFVFPVGITCVRANTEMLTLWWERVGKGG